MSLVAYLQSREISAMRDWDFSALIMAAMRKADTGNYLLLTVAFPDIGQELQDRYDADGGALDDDERAWLSDWLASGRRVP